MANILLNKMTIRNFKGIKDFTLDADGKTINVSGDNGTGKTTLYDAFLWCLFGKDSTDKTKFDWKPLDENNQEIHHLETEVEVELSIDGGAKTLSRMVSENWVKTRGQAVAEFKGHNTIYKMDGIQIKQKEYKEYLDQLIGEDTFRMLTNLTYFPETLKWEERRKVLIELAGDVSVEDVIKSNGNLKPLYDLLAERSLEDNVKLTKQQMTSINKQIKDIPQRIDEVDRSLPDVSKLNAKELKASLAAKQEEINAKRDEISSIRNGASGAKIKEQISTLRLHYAEMERDYTNQLESDLDGLIEKRQVALEELSALKLKADELKQSEGNINWDMQQCEREINQLTDLNIEARVGYKEIQEMEMPIFDEHVLSCPTCGQDFSEDKALEIQANYEKETAEFNVNKANKLEKIAIAGKSNNTAIEKLEAEIADFDKKLEALAESKTKLAKEMEAKMQEHANLTESIERERKSLNPFSSTEEALSIVEEISILQAKLNKDEQGQAERIKALETQYSELSQSEYAIRNDLMLFDQYDKQIARRTELIAEEQTLSLEYGKLEQRLFLLEAFVKTRVDLLTDTINSKFKLVKFKLFETAINGGIQEVCEPTVNGANYSTGLNNAARINAGLDIINTLMDHYGKRVPVFIDNSESINEILPIDTQLITLTVSKDKELKVEEI
ncbi:AAA family ATPase [Jeotgalibaca porci]|uniref:AAA family ATPase n=1 Tax=Jeotgalibaca porci TaxID=1868793 RepID=UPI0035A14DF7